MESLVGETYTLLKIKRKRRDEPLDGLVIEFSKRRKSRGGQALNDEKDTEKGVFQFAETVEEAIWKDESRVEAMHDRIASMARKTIPLKRNVSRVDSPVSQPDAQPSRRQYAVLPQTKEMEGLPSPGPPVVRSAREIREEREREKERERAAQCADAFMTYEAVPVEEMLNKGGKNLRSEDPMVASFLPMLEEYLRINDINIHDTPANGSSLPGNLDDEDDQYVWDVFIHRKTTLEEWNQIALLGSVTGVPNNDSYPSDESEAEDEADEDSNDENFYGNDYPDEEDSEDSERNHNSFNSDEDWE